MKIIFIFRKSGSGKSIENIFDVIHSELIKNHRVIKFYASSRLLFLYDVIRLWSYKADIYHITGDVNYFSIFLNKNKTLLTIHDIGNYLYGLVGIKKYLYKKIWLEWPLKNVSFVTVVSENTKKNIQEHLKNITKDVVVIPNCYDPLFIKSTHNFNFTIPRILQIGTAPYKNVPRLICALKGIKCILIIIGFLTDEIKQALNNTKVIYENYINVSKIELIYHYQNADIVSFVSLSEGFGMPIIEAQAFGKPLITSNLAPMSKVAGHGACLVDPTSVKEINKSLKKLINDDIYRAEIIENGLHNAENYKSETISKLYLSLYIKMYLSNKYGNKA